MDSMGFAHSPHRSRKRVVLVSAWNVLGQPSLHICESVTFALPKRHFRISKKPLGGREVPLGWRLHRARVSGKKALATCRGGRGNVRVCEPRLLGV